MEHKFVPEQLELEAVAKEESQEVSSDVYPSPEAEAMFSTSVDGVMPLDTIQRRRRMRRQNSEVSRTDSMRSEQLISPPPPSPGSRGLTRELAEDVNLQQLRRMEQQFQSAEREPPLLGRLGRSQSFAGAASAAASEPMSFGTAPIVSGASIVRRPTPPKPAAVWQRMTEKENLTYSQALGRSRPNPMLRIDVLRPGDGPASACASPSSLATPLRRSLSVRTPTRPPALVESDGVAAAIASAAEAAALSSPRPVVRAQTQGAAPLQGGFMPIAAGSPQDSRPSSSLQSSSEVTADEVAALVSDSLLSSGGRGPRVLIVDCRFPYEYDGGHIIGAVNIWTRDAVVREMLNSPISARGLRVIFHCEFSSVRAPDLYRQLRHDDRLRHPPTGAALATSLDSSLSSSLGDGDLFYSDVSVLRGGYKAFFRRHPNLCTPSAYVQMEDSRFVKEHRRCKRIMEGARRDRPRSCSDMQVADLLRGPAPLSSAAIKGVISHRPLGRVVVARRLASFPDTPSSQDTAFADSEIASASAGARPSAGFGLMHPLLATAEAGLVAARNRAGPRAQEMYRVQPPPTDGASTVVMSSSSSVPAADSAVQGTSVSSSDARPMGSIPRSVTSEQISTRPRVPKQSSSASNLITRIEAVLGGEDGFATAAAGAVPAAALPAWALSGGRIGGSGGARAMDDSDDDDDDDDDGGGRRDWGKDFSSSSSASEIDTFGARPME